MREYFLTTSRLGFSTWSLQDFDIAKQLWGDPKVTKLIGGTYSDDKIKARLTKEMNNYNDHKVQYWPIFNLETSEFVGCCGLCPYDASEGIFEIGFHLREKFWGQKLAFEAATAVLNYASNHLNIQKFFAGHNPKNVASSKLLLKLGFIYSHDEYYEPTGLNHPSYFYSIDSN